MYNLTVRVGSTENANGGSVYKVKGFKKHDKFDHKTVDWDFALLELEDGIEFSEAAKPIKMMDREQKTIDKTMCLVTGWGSTASNPTFIQSNGKLLGTEVPIMSQTKCVDVYKNRRGVTDRMLCAGLEQGGKDACQSNYHCVRFMFGFCFYFTQQNELTYNTKLNSVYR